MNYSIEFTALINNPKLFAELMENNESSPRYADWEKKRRFIASVIESDGTILDIGCAGGMFLLSLQEWSGYKLTPYGVDIISKYIKSAKKLFPKYKENFTLLDVSEIERLKDKGLPNKYDYVYWNYLGTKYFQDKNIDKTIKNVINLASKRVIFGFYRANPPDATKKEKADDLKKLEARVENFKNKYKVSGTKYNPTDFHQAIVWIDKN